MLPIPTDRRVKVSEYQDKFTREDLIAAVNDQIDTLRGLIEDLPDTYVTFQPVDEDAFDRFATTEEEKDIAWTLGHLIVHVTASAEEACALGSYMARGVEIEQRSRYETHWTTMKTIAQCLARLEESRRIQLAYLNTWPDEPVLSVMWDGYERWAGKLNALGRTALGLLHGYGHYDQIKDVIAQGKEAGL